MKNIDLQQIYCVCVYIYICRIKQYNNTANLLALPIHQTGIKCLYLRWINLAFHSTGEGGRAGEPGQSARPTGRSGV